MATITVNPDNSLALNLTADERAIYDGLQSGQLAEFITLWLSERFTTSWKNKIDQLTNKQKKELATLVKDAIKLDPPTD